MRKVTFKKDYRNKKGAVRYRKGETHYMHKSVAALVAKHADVEEINWKKVHADAKAQHEKVEVARKKAQAS